MRLLAVAGEPLTYVLVKESNIATVHHAEHPSFAALSRAPLKTSVSTAGLSGEAAQMYSQIWSGEHLSFNVEHRAGGRGGVIQVTVLPEAGIPGTVEQRTVQISLLSLCLDTLCLDTSASQRRFTLDLRTCLSYTWQRRQPKSGPRATWRRTCSTARPGPGPRFTPRKSKRRLKINP